MNSAVQQQTATEACPWCESPITRQKFNEIQRIREDEQRKLQRKEIDIRAALTKQFDEKMQEEKRAAQQRLEEEMKRRADDLEAERERLGEKVKEAEAQEAAAKQARLEAKRHAEESIQKQQADSEKKIAEVKRASEEQVRAELKKRDEALSAERELLAKEREAVQEREATTKVAAADVAKKIADAEERAADEIAKNEKAAAEHLKAELRKRDEVLVRERETLQAQLAAVEEREAVAKAAHEEMKGRLEAAEQTKKDELSKQREILKQANDSELMKQQIEFNREREKYQRKLDEMKRQFEAKTANQLGDGAELNLFEELKGVFEGDHLKPVKKGQPGADIIHDVRHRGNACGRIVYDSKNRSQWRNSYVTKLREDKAKHKAAHAILATTVFPAGKKNLMIDDDVIIISPAYAVAMVQVLRQFMQRSHQQGLSTQEREGKMAKLYEYVTSDAFARHLKSTGKLAEQLEDLDVQEANQHKKTWEKRGRIIKKLQHNNQDVEGEIAAIIEGAESEA